MTGPEAFIFKDFVEIGEWEAVNAVEKWLSDRGFSFGTMQGDAPRGIRFGEFRIAKWRNLSVDDIKAFDGLIGNTSRYGPVRVTIFASCPAEGLARVKADAAA